MSLLESLKDMDRKFSWSFFGFMLAALFGVITLYTQFVKENKPDLNYVITANASVLDIREKLGDLDVFYQGESLSRNNKSLRFITFEVINQGDAAILSNFYDQNDPIGFSIADGVIADEPVLIDASNKYLRNKLQIEKQSDTEVFFSNVIIEPGELFRVKVLVLHETQKKPTINAFGKIAGVSRIDVLSDYKPGGKKSIFADIFSGEAYVNIARFFAYGIIFFLVLILIIVSGVLISEAKEKIRKNRLVKIFKEYDANKISKKDNFFFDYYMSIDGSFIARLYDFLSDEDGLNEIANTQGGSSNMSRDGELFEELLREEIIYIKDGNVIVDDKRYSVLVDFYNYLKRKGEFKRSLSLESIIHERNNVVVNAEDEP